DNVVPNIEYGMAIFNRLVKIRDARQPVSVVTSRGTWDNMVLSFSVPDDVSSARGLEFTATLKQITIVENQRITLQRAAEPRGKGKAKRGALGARFISAVGDAFAQATGQLVFTIRPGQTVFDEKHWWKKRALDSKE